MNLISSCFAGTATILTCKHIAQSFHENIYELSAIKSEWTPGYATRLKGRIKSVLETYFTESGTSCEDEKRNHLNESMITALIDLGVFRALLRVDFKDDKEFEKDCFHRLGYVNYFSDAKNGDHYSLYMLLDTFNKEMTPPLESKIVSGGIKVEIIHRIQSHSKNLDDLKRCFDLLTVSDELCAAAKLELNEVYSQIKDICRVATAYYQFDPSKRELFDFYKVMIRLKQLPVRA
ncbi:MAG: hypothetical protein A2W90_20950 [Bacteroidetes bacterium GWF2_42_66]|nr:MAG: hypothetical protein A2W92_12375 [Bacteroidetes bacterium GWA2_42_15]OFX99208.1 MAG: hypothetical protein A2W89_03630 [Bacteroidetes bacterium GWE2_42_39]OFY40604.1 MAG: hypothetical protein A2W90_20950 [Bacteroidetes bacterium GWF2_42_66]HBL74559.1 hypothetical protein [Prolixibacteraceae bacterium]HCR88993.1 hypothetical protein [Prolixibacteraceae bacterium]